MKQYRFKYIAYNRLTAAYGLAAVKEVTVSVLANEELEAYEKVVKAIKREYYELIEVNEEI